MNIIVIPDIHTRYEKAERICRKYKSHKIVFIGDYFDDFNDTPDDNQYTAEWLSESLKKENRVHLIGNHDECYHPNRELFCSGFSSKKKEVINKVLTTADWDKLNYYHFENNWLFSHAGINRYWFGDPLNGKIHLNIIRNTINDSIKKQSIGYTNNAIWAADKYRSGNHEWGGILWQDWKKMELIPDLKQCVGHTPIPKIQIISDNITNSHIMNVDNSAMSIYMSEIVEIEENGNVNRIDTSYV
jgi:hypothetical protein